MFKNVSVFGFGLLGGSICKKLKELHGADVVLAAYGRNRSRLEPGLRDGTVDSIGGIEDASLAGADLVIVSTPIDSSIDIIISILDSGELGDSALVIDVGSVKGEIIRRIAPHPRSGQFIGCHPMAGSEKTGYEHGTASLYEGSTVIITPHLANRNEPVALVQRFWESLGARTHITTPELHDRMVSYTSHLPHVAACALVSQLISIAGVAGAADVLQPFIGNGLRDTTRIASGSPDMWRDIVISNADQIAARIDSLIGELTRFREHIGDADFLHGFFMKVKEYRDGMK